MSDSFSILPINLNVKSGTAGLYVRGDIPARDETGALVIRRGSAVVFDGFLSSLFEREMRLFLANSDVELRLSFVGECSVQIIHRSQNGVETCQAAQAFTHPELAEATIPVRISLAEQHTGRLFFILAAHKGDVRLAKAEWSIPIESPPPSIRPEVVICTFKREAQVTRNIALIRKTLKQAGVSFGVTIVDNAQTLSPDADWGDDVRLVAQRNLGGAGGFGRGILETLDGGLATHIILLDDDADIDPTSLVRMINLLRLSRNPDLFVGGMQLDAFDPCRLADAGSFWYPDEFEKVSARRTPTSLANRETLDDLCRLSRSNFNGWWMFGGSVEAFRKFGMPLPCFVHLDDVEFGVRIAQNGGDTVNFPGVAIWHEPYYAKLEGWFAYYNIRNELIRQACQSENPVRLSRLLKRLRRRHRKFLLTYQYGAAALLSLAIEDFLRGPSLLAKDDPEGIHARVLSTYRQSNGNHSIIPFSISSFRYRSPRPGSSFKAFIDRLTLNGHILSTRRANSDELVLFASAAEIDERKIVGGLAWAYGDP